jgi:hypothetical protein
MLAGKGMEGGQPEVSRLTCRPIEASVAKHRKEG